jgi:hypothetical protein
MNKKVSDSIEAKNTALDACKKAKDDHQLLQKETEYWLYLYGLSRIPFADFCGNSGVNWRLDPRLWGLTLVLDTSVVHDINMLGKCGTRSFVLSINNWAVRYKIEVCIFFPYSVLSELDHQKDKNASDTALRTRVIRHNSEWNECLQFAGSIKVKLVTQSSPDYKAALRKEGQVFVEKSLRRHMKNRDNDQEILRIVNYINENSKTPLVMVSSDSGCAPDYGDRQDDGVNFIMVDKKIPDTSIISSLDRFMNTSTGVEWKYLVKTAPIINSAIQKMREINNLKTA